ncbi:MAG: NAD(P)/FAD-dependent oxidoreductase [Thermacetogeniaceae bacterium]|jgi:uncharacterized FAD-dependent dehydrogenase|nr:NAD(P)/FAD-dependent oxidoreductase [Syntrophomonadaceae bacterium]
MKKYDCIIVGAGPAGIFCALELVRQKKGLNILILDKGRDLKNRKCPSREKHAPCFGCDSCAVVSGWGGAGAFSDGKLAYSTEVGGMLGSYLDRNEFEEGIKYIHDIYLEFGAPRKIYGLENIDQIELLQKKAALAGMRLVNAPVRHLGTGRTKEILQKMQDYLLQQGVSVQTKTPVERIEVKDGVAVGVRTADGEQLAAKYVVCAPGRNGAEWLVKEAERLGLERAINPVDIGLRIELSAAVMEQITDLTYEGKFLFISPTFEDRVRTFCMNPYGEVVMENTDGLLTVNGHTHADYKTENTNFALLVSKTFTEPFKQPITYGKYIASLANMLGGGVIVQRLGDLMKGRRSTAERIEKGMVVPTLKEAIPGDLSLVLPYRYLLAIVEMLKAMDQVAPGVYSPHTLLYGIEVKFYSSRLKVSRKLETQLKNLFVAGDGAGITRGLTQASLSGVIAARSITTPSS